MSLYHVQNLVRGRNWKEVVLLQRAERYSHADYGFAGGRGKEYTKSIAA